MSQPGHIKDREFTKFVDSPSRPNSSSVETIVSNDYGNPLPVDITDRGTTKFVYNEIVLNTASMLDIISLTVAPGKGIDLKNASCSGENRCVFKVEINGQGLDLKRIYYTNYNLDFNFKNLSIAEGDNIKIIVENKTNTPGTFNSNLIYSEYDL